VKLSRSEDAQATVCGVSAQKKLSTTVVYTVVPVEPRNSVIPRPEMVFPQLYFWGPDFSNVSPLMQHSEVVACWKVIEDAGVYPKLHTPGEKTIGTS
jgi:hypothetical protein